MKPRAIVDRALAESHLHPDEIDHLLFAGAPTNSQFVKEKLAERLLHKHLNIVYTDDSWPALGAAIQAALLTNDLKDLVTWDVLSVPVGIQLPDGKFKPLIARGTPLPVTAYHAFASPDGTINASVLQGESDIAEENAPLAELTINNCPPTSAQETKVEVAFCIRQDGIVHYSARHIGLGVNLTVGVHEGERVQHKASPPEAKIQDNNLVVTETAISGLEAQFAAPAAKRTKEIQALKQKFATLQWTYHFKFLPVLAKRYAVYHHLNIQRHLDPPDAESTPKAKHVRRSFFVVPPNRRE